MNTYEQLLYLLRIPFILLVVIIVAVIFAYLTPTLDNADTGIGEGSGIAPLRADHYTAVVAHHDTLYAAPGVIDEQAFTQETADELLRFSEPRPFLYVVRAELTDNQGASVIGNITYNQEAWRVLEHAREIRGTKELTKTLPVTLQRTDETREPAILVLRAYYET